MAEYVSGQHLQRGSEDIARANLVQARAAVADQLWLGLIRLARRHRLTVRTGYNGGLAHIDVTDYWGHHLAAFSGSSADDCIEQVLNQTAGKLAGQTPPGQVSP